MAINGLIITGSAGFIGINMMSWLLKHESYYHFYVCLDKMGYATVYNKNQYNTICSKNLVLRVDCDINDPIKLKALFAASNIWASDWVIVDFASNSHVDSSIENPSSIYEENCTIPSNLLLALGRENWKDIRHYYHISTDEVYGDIPLSSKDDHYRHFTPLSTLHPSNPYSASKVAQDMYLTAMKRTFDIPVSIIRMANQFGPWQHLEKMIPASILRALRGDTIKIYGEGKNCRQWTFVEDTVDAIGNIITMYPQRESLFDPPIIHLADKKNIMNNNELIQKIIISLSRYNIDVRLEYIKDRLGHDEMYALNVHDQDQVYFKTPFDIALDKTVDHYVERFRNGEFT